MTLNQLTERVEFWKKELSELGLSHYTFTVRWSEAPFGNTNAAASVDTYSSYDAFDLEFSRSWVHKHTSEEVDEVILHELMHVLFRHLDRLAEQMEEHLPPAMYRMWMDNFEYHTETVVRRLATAIVAISK